MDHVQGEWVKDNDNTDVYSMPYLQGYSPSMGRARAYIVHGRDNVRTVVNEVSRTVPCVCCVHVSNHVLMRIIHDVAAYMTPNMHAYTHMHT